MEDNHVNSLEATYGGHEEILLMAQATKEKGQIPKA
jgi:hypothetical protein